MNRRFVVLSAGRYRFEIPEYATTFEADRLHWDKYELGGELVVRCGLPGARTHDGVLSWATFNFTSSSARHTLGKRLEVKTAAVEILWDDLLESFCHQVLAAERTGDPPVLLADVPEPPADDLFVVDKLQIPKTVPSILFGDGDSFKSTLALYLAGQLSKAGVGVGFADWELNKSLQRRRYRQLFGSEMPGDLVYVECTRPLVQEADRLARIVSECRLEFAVFDSVVPACGNKPEDSDQASGYFRALRQLGGPAFTSLHIAHVTKAENGDAKPFGSVFWSNLCRQSWFVQTSDSQADDAITVALFPRKHNLGPRGSAVGFAVTFLQDQITIRPADVADVPELAGRLPLWQRVQHTLGRDGPQTLATLAAELDAKVDSLEKVVTRGKGQLFTRVPGRDGVTRIALVERRGL